MAAVAVAALQRPGQQPPPLHRLGGGAWTHGCPRQCLGGTWGQRGGVRAAPRERGASPTSDRTTNPQAEARGGGEGRPSHKAAAQKVKEKVSAQKAFARSLKG